MHRCRYKYEGKEVKEQEKARQESTRLEQQAQSQNQTGGGDQGFPGNPSHPTESSSVEELTGD
ncbi:MAG: hypothetical protein IVW55_04080 [Chloroflexi bacterium]|nr:hypothetical protein [Chloroflexota bacterium]